MLRWQASSSAQVRDLRVSFRMDGLRTSVRTCPAEAGRKSARCNRRTQGFGSAIVGQDRASARNCATAGQDASLRNAEVDPGLRPGNLPSTAEASPRHGRAGTGTPVPDLPKGETSGLRPWRGACGETGGSASFPKDSGSPDPSPRLGPGFEKAQGGTPRLPGLVTPAAGQWGLAATPAPISFAVRPAV